MPDYKYLKNYKPPVSSKLYSGNGVLVSDFSSEKRIFVPYSAISQTVINAFLSAEDKNFFDHPGVDAKGVVRAIKNNIFNLLYSKRLEGASTITQQVAKNFLLTNEVSIDRKIKEAILAFRIERVLSKKRILELYLNQIYLGEGSYGIASASLRYFNKPISELNYGEAALLAALPKAPSKYNPYKNKELAKFRRNLVLNNLLDNGFIDQKQHSKLINSKINDPVSMIREITDQRGVDFAFEAVGLSVTIQQAFDSLAKTGKTIVIGIPSNDTHISISAVPLVFEERTITGSLYGSAAPKLDIPNMIKLYEDGKLNLDSLLTDRYPLEEINEAYDAMIKGKSLRSVIVF